MKLILRDGLPYTQVTLTHQDQTLTLANILIDTGSAGTLFPADLVAALGIMPAPQDSVYRIRGVGGSEFVFTRHIDKLEVGDLQAIDFEIEIGAVNYGFAINGILGMDFLVEAAAVIDLGHLELRKTN
jgi:hypothetical protein